MTYWLIDNSITVFVFLAACALVLAVLFVKTKNRRCLGGLAVVAVLALVVVLLQIFVESDRQRIERVIRDIAAAVATNDVDRFFSHVSEDFKQEQLASKAEFRDRAGGAMRSYKVNGMEVWDFQPIRISRSERTGVMSFHFKPRGDWGAEYFWRCEAKFKLEADDQWRLVDFELFKPQSEQRVRLPF